MPDLSRPRIELLNGAACSPAAAAAVVAAVERFLAETAPAGGNGNGAANGRLNGRPDGAGNGNGCVNAWHRAALADCSDNLPAPTGTW